MMKRIGRKLTLALASLALALSLTSLGHSSAFALRGVCRADPVLVLSNSVTLTLYEDISDTVADVTKMTYDVHIPRGVTVKSISYPGDFPASIQTVTVTADQSAGNYDGYTVVYTKTANISVTAYGQANSTVSTHTSGHSGQQIHSHLHLS